MRPRAPLSVRTWPRSGPTNLTSQPGTVAQHLVGADRVEGGELVEDEDGYLHGGIIAPCRRGFQWQDCQCSLDFCHAPCGRALPRRAGRLRPDLSGARLHDRRPRPTGSRSTSSRPARSGGGADGRRPGSRSSRRAASSCSTGPTPWSSPPTSRCSRRRPRRCWMRCVPRRRGEPACSRSAPAPSPSPTPACSTAGGRPPTGHSPTSWRIASRRSRSMRRRSTSTKAR